MNLLLNTFPRCHIGNGRTLVQLSGSTLSLEPLESHIMRRDAFSEKALGGNIASHNLGRAMCTWGGGATEDIFELDFEELLLKGFPRLFIYIFRAPFLLSLPSLFIVPKTPDVREGGNCPLLFPRARVDLRASVW